MSFSYLSYVLQHVNINATITQTAVWFLMLTVHVNVVIVGHYVSGARQLNLYKPAATWIIFKGLVWEKMLN